MTKEIVVKTGALVEARALAQLVAIAGKYSSHILMSMDGKTVNAKSIMGLMGFGLDADMKVEIEAVGDDEAEAIVALEEFLTSQV